MSRPEMLGKEETLREIQKRIREVDCQPEGETSEEKRRQLALLRELRRAKKKALSRDMKEPIRRFR